jgi:CBS domain-containing protein
MPVIDHRHVLKGLTVREAMRRQVIHLPQEANLEQAIRYAIKFKVNAILITDSQQRALGVVSKTDLMGAYYAGLPLVTLLAEIMVGPLLFCHLYDSLDDALDLMRQSGIHRLYVLEDVPDLAVGVLAYPDIVGLLYRYCRRCERSILRLNQGGRQEEQEDHFRVRDVMTSQVTSFPEGASLMEVMEGLATYRLAAVLIKGSAGLPTGVVSKTDLILTYKHGFPAGVPAKTIMNSPVQDCDQDEYLALAIQQMIFSDIHRLFVCKGDSQEIVGVLSLSDAARFRSGTCRACLVSRIAV